MDSFRYPLTAGWPWHAHRSKGVCQWLLLSTSRGHLDTTAWPWLYLQVKQHDLMWTSFCLTVEIMNGVVFFQENPVRLQTKMLMPLTGESMPWSELRSMSNAVHLGVPSIWRIMVLSAFPSRVSARIWYFDQYQQHYNFDGLLWIRLYLLTIQNGLSAIWSTKDFLCCSQRSV